MNKECQGKKGEAGARKKGKIGKKPCTRMRENVSQSARTRNTPRKL